MIGYEQWASYIQLVLLSIILYYFVMIICNLMRYCCELCPQTNGKEHSKWCTQLWVPPRKRQRFSMKESDKDEGGCTDQVGNLLKEVKAFSLIVSKGDVKKQDAKGLKRKLEDVDCFKMEKLLLALENIDV